jgi:hypothetical protein
VSIQAEPQGSGGTLGTRRSGWLTFAAVVMFAVALARLVSALNYFGGGARVSDLTGSLYGEQLWVWGIWDLVIAALALFGGLSLLFNGRFGRIVGYVWGIVVMFQSLLIISVAPWYAFTAIALAGLVVAALARSQDAGTGW